MIILINDSYDIISIEDNVYSPAYIIFFLNQSRIGIRSSKNDKLKIWRRLVSIYCEYCTSPQDYNNLYLL